MDEPPGRTFAAARTWWPPIAGRCNEVESGARNIDHILTRTLLPEMSAEFLGRMADGQEIETVRVSLAADGKFQYELP